MRYSFKAWEALKLSACPCLESLTLTLPLVLPITHAKPRTRAPRVRSHPGVALTSILAHAPATLRALTLTITGVGHTAPFAPRDLAGADAALARLPGLTRVVCVLELRCAGARCPYASDDEWRDCAERYASVVLDALEGAGERRVLEVRTVTL